MTAYDYIRDGAEIYRNSFAIIRRVAIGTFNDGFIHAGNLAYLAMLAIFPFFILGAALFDRAGIAGALPAIVVGRATL